MHASRDADYRVMRALEVELGGRVFTCLGWEQNDHPSPWWRIRNRVATIAHRALGGHENYEPTATWRMAHDRIAIAVADDLAARPGTPEDRGALF